MAETLLTWVLPVRADRIEPLAAQLGQVQADLALPADSQTLIPFGRLEMLHFASVLLFRGPGAPVLVIESNIDEPSQAYIARLVSVASPALHRLFCHCEGYPCPSTADPEVVRRYLEKPHKPQLYHVGHPNRSPQEIRGDRELRTAIVNELDADPTLRASAPVEILREVRARANCPRSMWPFWRPSSRTWSGRLEDITWQRDSWPWAHFWWSLLFLVIAALVAVAGISLFSVTLGAPLWGTIGVEAIAAVVTARQYLGLPIYGVPSVGAALAAVAAGLWLAFFLWSRLPLSESWVVSLLILALPAYFAYVSVQVWAGMSAFTSPFPPLDEQQAARLRSLEEADDQTQYSPQNHIAGLNVIPAGPASWLRIVRVHFLLGAFNLFYRTFFVHGRLGTVPSIHFAQWSIVPGRRILFLTNYDGTWDRYLDDFFRGLGLGIAMIWYHTAGFPRTLDPRHLKNWVRDHQTLAAVRYRSPVYAGTTVGAINNNTAIRRALLRRPTPARARRWLQLLAVVTGKVGVFDRLFGWIRARVGLAA